MSGGRAHVLVFANEKGGTSKSTTAVHVGVSLALQGRSVIALDLDTRQKTLARYLENRAATATREDRVLEGPRFEVFDPAEGPIEARIDDLSRDAEFLMIDTPGRGDPHAIKAVARADTLVTPINDSFIDLDLIERSIRIPTGSSVSASTRRRYGKRERSARQGTAGPSIGSCYVTVSSISSRRTCGA